MRSRHAAEVFWTVEGREEEVLVKTSDPWVGTAWEIWGGTC